MFRTRLPLFIVLVFLSFVSYAQKEFNEAVIIPFQKDALLREKVFIHSNKTSYFTNEQIWFTAYVVEDSNNTPSNLTTNLHVNLIDATGKVFIDKTIFIKNGIGVGDFFIDNNLSAGTYYIGAATNYMRNFGEENIFTTAITILKPVNKPRILTTANTIAYDIQAFPESGYLLEDTDNVIGIKALVNGKGQPFTGKLINSSGLEIASFQGNNFGMAKAVFTYIKEETYRAIIDINNSTQEIKIPKAKKTGIIFSLENSDTDKLKLILKTNSETLPHLKNEQLALLVYRNNFIGEAITLTLSSTEKTSQELYIDKAKLLYGVNTVTLFRNLEPIAERKFYVEQQNQQTAILIEETETTTDSISFKIQTIDPNYSAVSAQLSISILPADAKNYKETQNIKSAFLLSPYLKGTIENPAYYFKNEKPKEKEFLDLLILNQGWSAYTLAAKINKINPKEQFAFESGFTIDGALKRYPKGYDIGLLSKKNELAAFSPISKENKFSFENIYAYKNDSIKIALIKKNQPLVKPTDVSFIEPPKDLKHFSSLIEQHYHVEKTEPSQVSKAENEYNFYPTSELLDEIILKAGSAQNKEATIYDLELNLASKRNMISSASYKGKKVTKQMETNYQTLFDYFRSLGYIKPSISDKIASYYISLRNGPATMIDLGGNANPDGTFPPRVFVNNIMLNRFNNIEILEQLSMKDVDEILVNPSGAGGGADGTGGMIRIYLKEGNHQYFGDGVKKLYQNLILNTGFDRAKTYYTPQYNTLTKEAFNWVEIDWINALKTDKNGTAILKVPTNKFTANFQFVVNGISDDGLLFHTIYKTGANGF
tara:strand:+ start:197797 stop:200271 length:2475 start_codon:yes stop_codon:yes gene_type:complete